MLSRAIAAILAGTTTSRALIETCLGRIEDRDGQGTTTFLKVHADAARKQADELDRRIRKGDDVPALAGIPVSIKDLFDIRGDVTTAGSKVLVDNAPARKDASAVARLRAAGCIVIGRTNMTEFAYSGLGINPHYGTPLNPFDRAARRIPGGSSSGAAVAISDEMALASLGTDTGGSCRIPAALTGIVGFKPTAARIPRRGVYPLSPTLDCVGPLASSVEDCALLDAALAGETVRAETPAQLATLRLWVPSTLVLDSLDPHVAATFERALHALSRAGVQVDEVALSALARVPQLNSRGGIAAYEAYAEHRALLESRQADYDPRVATRILKGREISEKDHAQLLQARLSIIREVNDLTGEYDALVMPAVPLIAPRLDEFAKDERYLALNGLMLRNAMLANFLDRCAISLPMHRAGEAPAGLMLVGKHAGDRRLLAVAAAIEAVLAGGKSAGIGHRSARKS